MKRSTVITLMLVIAYVFIVQAQESVDLQVIMKIKEEGFNNSQVMEILFYLTDAHGPRLTSSPNFKAASQWCVDKLSEWGSKRSSGILGHLWPWLDIP